MSPMGGKKHKGVGMNRKVKRKVLPAENLPSEVEGSGEESEAEPEDDQELPEPGCTCHTPDESILGPRFSKLAFEAAREEMIKAKKDVQKYEKKWRKVKQTYVDSGKYSPWAEESVVKRVQMRLLNADENLGSARHTYMRMRMQWVRLRSYHQLRRSWHASGHVDSVLEKFCDRAFQRVLDPLPEPSFTSSMSMWPGYPQDIWDFNQRNYGLALTWGMTHVDSLRPRDIYESKRARLRQVQAAATAQEREDSRQEREHEREEIRQECKELLMAHAKRVAEQGGPTQTGTTDLRAAAQ